MLHAGDRQDRPHHRADLVAAVATCIDDDFSLYIARLCVHNPAVIRALRQPCHGAVTDHPSSRVTRPSRQRLAELGWVNISIQRVPKPTNKPIGLQKWMPPRTFGRINHLKFNTHSPSHRGKVAIRLHLRLGLCKPDTAVSMVVVDWILWIFRQLFIERNRV